MTGQLQSEDQEVALVHLLKSSTTYHLAKKVAREALEENASWKTSKVEQTPLLPKEAQEKILQIQESLRGHLRHVQSRHTQDSRKLSLRFQGTLKSDLESKQFIKGAIENAAKTLDSVKRRRLSRICVDLDVPFIRLRSPREEAMLIESEEGGFSHVASETLCSGEGLPSRATQPLPLAVDRLCLYDESDLFEAIQAIHTNSSMYTPNRTDLAEDSNLAGFWSCFTLPFATPDYPCLSHKFHDLNPRNRQMGLDDTVEGTQRDAYIKSRIQTGETIIYNQSSLKAKEYAKRGIPMSLRGRLWDLIIQSDLTDDLKVHCKTYCKKLKKMVARYDLLIDRILVMDVKHAQNDDAYFVFEDTLKEVMMFWSRDEWLVDKVSRPFDLMQSHRSRRDGALKLEKESWSQSSDRYPPNAIVPFWGMTCYAMPLCYVHAEKESMYFTFRELYVRYFSHLSTISDSKNGITYLCVAFENFLKQADSYLYFHLHHSMNLPPAKLAYRWIIYAFVGILEPDQVLLLWDRMVGYDSTLIFSVLAAALFVFRRNALLQSGTEKDVKAALSDFTGIQVIPILQQFIFNQELSNRC